LTINQIKGEYEVRHKDLIPYHHTTTKLANTFDGFYISYVSHLQNTRADVLVTLAATLALSTDTSYRLTVDTRHLFYLKYNLEVSKVIQPQQTLNLKTSNSLLSIMPCTAYYSMIPRR